MITTERAREALSGADAPRFVDVASRAAVVGEGERGAAILSGLVAGGALTVAGQGLYANRLASPSVHPNEVVAHLAPEAYASLHTVLGEHGVANNPSRTVYAVRRADRDARVPDARMRFPFAEYRVLAMDAAVIEAGEEADRLEPGGRYRRATPERAFLDWIHLSSEAGGRLLGEPPLDLDLSDLDEGRISRLAEAMGARAPLSAWMARHAAAMADPAFSEQYSPSLGF